MAVRMARLASAESAPFRVAPGEVARVELVAEEGTTVVAVCKGRGDDPVPSARVQLLDDQGRDVSRRIGLADVQNLYKAAAFDLAERRMGPFPRVSTCSWQSPTTADARRRSSASSRAAGSGA